MDDEFFTLGTEDELDEEAVELPEVAEARRSSVSDWAAGGGEGQARPPTPARMDAGLGDADLLDEAVSADPARFGRR